MIVWTNLDVEPCSDPRTMNVSMRGVEIDERHLQRVVCSILSDLLGALNDAPLLGDDRRPKDCE